MKVIDLTHTISETMPVYPGTEQPRLTPANSYEKDGFKETLLSMYSHTGTHVDPPAHLFAGRTTLDAFPVNQFVGRAVVIDCRHLKEGEAITMREIAPRRCGKGGLSAVQPWLGRALGHGGILRRLSLHRRRGYRLYTCHEQKGHWVRRYRRGPHTGRRSAAAQKAVCRARDSQHREPDQS